MLNCVAAIQFDEEKKVFILVSGDNRVEIGETKALIEFVNNAPEISPDIVALVVTILVLTIPILPLAPPETNIVTTLPEKLLESIVKLSPVTVIDAILSD